MPEALKQKQKLRLAVLHNLYEMSASDVHKNVNGALLYEACEANDEASFKSAVAYLEGEYLIEATWVLAGFPASLRIKHQGIVEVEGAFSQPDQPSQHFMPVNVLYVNQMIGSAIQQGTTNSSQNFTGSVEIGAKDALAKFVELATKIVDPNQSESAHWQEIKSEVETLRAQASSPNPKRAIIREGLASLGRLCESAAAGAIGTQLATYYLLCSPCSDEA